MYVCMVCMYVLYCIALHGIALHCIVLYCKVCMVWYGMYIYMYMYIYIYIYIDICTKIYHSSWIYKVPEKVP